MRRSAIVIWEELFNDGEGGEFPMAHPKAEQKIIELQMGIGASDLFC
ncbi:hypothetical protein [Teredinibacter franksiae]|nr:hypothetical protein [Teredinibacter franksiae]